MKAVLFDIDNTLLIKRPTNAEKWHEVLCAAGYNLSPLDTRRAFAECEMWVGEQVRLENESGVQLSDEDFMAGVMQCCTDALGIDSGAADILAPVWAGRYAIKYEIAAEAQALLEFLHSEGIALGIVSNNRPAIRAVLAKTELDRYFSTIVISEEVGLYKPDPRILHYALEILGVQPGDALYVGDHPYDVVCAHEAGLHAAWIPVNEFMQLPKGTKAPLFRPESLAALAYSIKEF